MANRKRYTKPNDAANDVQDTGVPSVRSEGEEKVSDVGRSRIEFLNGAPFLFHNAHVRGGRRKDAKCSICGYKMENFVITVEKPAPESKVGESDRTDGELPTSSSLDSSLSRIFGV